VSHREGMLVGPGCQEDTHRVRHFELSFGEAGHSPAWGQDSMVQAAGGQCSQDSHPGLLTPEASVQLPESSVVAGAWAPSFGECDHSSSVGL
jgi:hypothetical protein